MSGQAPIGRLCAVCFSRHTSVATTSNALRSHRRPAQSSGIAPSPIPASLVLPAGVRPASGLASRATCTTSPSSAKLPQPNVAQSRLLRTSSTLSRGPSTHPNGNPSAHVPQLRGLQGVRVPPKLTVADFQPAPPPTTRGIVKVLLQRIAEWIDSQRTLSRLMAYGFSQDEAATWLDRWRGSVEDGLNFTESEEEAREALERGGWDRDSLGYGLQRDNWTAVFESAYLRHFLTWTVAQSPTSPPSPPPASARKGGQPALPASLINHLDTILRITDLSRQPFAGPCLPARSISRHFHLHIGPTNSGKTYSALKALSRAPTGVYAGPLRLLAHEVWERLNLGTVGDLNGQGRACNLLTGEERRIVDEHSGLMSCTVEMVPRDQPTGEAFDVVVIDEIQMLGDPQRGGAWTQAVLGVKAKEIHLCGDETTLSLLERLIPSLGDQLTVHRYERLTPLAVADASLDGDWNKIEAGDCVVTFSRSNIFTVKRYIEQVAGKKCAVVYGALPPETRAEQAKDFNEGKAQVLVASDAVGMGLNLKIKRMIFESLHKFNGKIDVPLPLTAIKQIAGRAGRFGMHKTPTPADVDADADTATEHDIRLDADILTPLPASVDAPGGEVTTLYNVDLNLLRQLLPLPLPSVSRAVIDVPISVISDLAPLLDPSLTYAELLDHVHALARLPTHTTLGEVSNRATLADMLEEFRDHLTLADIDILSFAPVNVRDPIATAIFRSVAERYATTGTVELSPIMAPSRLLTLLDNVEATLAALPPIPPIWGMGRRPLVPPLIISSIPNLETLHKSLVFYIWLSFRLAIAFPDRAAAQDAKTRCEAVLDQCLQRLPGLRNKKHYEFGKAEGREYAAWRKQNVAPDGYNWEATKKRKQQRKHFSKERPSEPRKGRNNGDRVDDGEGERTTGDGTMAVREGGGGRKSIKWSGGQSEKGRLMAQKWAQVGLMDTPARTSGEDWGRARDGHEDRTRERVRERGVPPHIGREGITGRGEARS